MPIPTYESSNSSSTSPFATEQKIDHQTNRAIISEGTSDRHDGRQKDHSHQEQLPSTQPDENKNKAPETSNQKKSGQNNVQRIDSGTKSTTSTQPEYTNVDQQKNNNIKSLPLLGNIKIKDDENLGQSDQDSSDNSQDQKSIGDSNKKKGKTSSLSINDNENEESGTIKSLQEDQMASDGSNKDLDTTTLKPGAPDKNSNRSCCFCWCCCCSCSCLSVKNNQGKGSKENNKQQLQQVSPLDHYFNEDDDQPPSIEEIRSWAESFDKVMKCSWGRKVFRDFLKCEYSEENILFWLACEDLKTESNPDVIEEKARLIYEDYISILSPKEVSLDSRVREIINKNMVEPTSNTFDEAQLQIYTLMHRDSFPRFINSPTYRKLAQLPSPSRKGSAA